MNIITAVDTQLTLWENLFSEEEKELIFQNLHKTTLWIQDSIQMFGKTIPVPRLQAWYGDAGVNYSYSGIHLTPAPWTPLLLALKKQVEETTGHRFNSVLLNLYRNGQDSNGWHSDNEPELGKKPVIASLSFGATRRFRLKHLQAKDREIKPISFDLTSGSLLLMNEQTQTHWQHCLPKSARVMAPRINLTFRYIYDRQ